MCDLKQYCDKASCEGCEIAKREKDIEEFEKAKEAFLQPLNEIIEKVMKALKRISS